MEQGTGALLQAQGIWKRYGGIDALSGVDLEICHGEVVALMGKHGAGKSTMAKIVAGVERPDAGTLHWDGALVEFRDTRDATHAGIAIVLQERSRRRAPIRSAVLRGVSSGSAHD